MGPELGWVVAWLLISVGFSVGTLSLAVHWALGPLRRAGECPWYERARLAQAGRMTEALSIVPVMAICGFFGLMLAEGQSSQPRWFGLAGLLGGGLAITWVSFRLTQRLRQPRITLGYWLAGIVTYCVLFLGNHAAFLLILFSTPGNFGTSTIVAIGIALLGMLLLFRGGHLHFLRWVGLAQPASQRLTNIVAAAATRAGTAPPPSYELRWPMVNAFAFQAPQRIAVSDAAMSALDDAQLEAICVHEMAHLKEPRRIVLLRALSWMLLIPVAVSIILIRTYGPLVFVLTMAFFLIARRRAAAMSRQWEQEADAQATDGQSPDRIYAGALLRLYETNLLPLVGYFHGDTHPHGYDRLVAAGLQPDFPRPAPPSLARGIVGAAIVTLMLIILNVVLFVALVLIGVITDSRDVALPG